MQQAKNLVHQNTRGESNRRLPRDVQVSTGSASAEAVSQSSATPTGAAAAAAAAFEAPASMQSSAPLDSICTDEQAEAQPGSTRFVAETRLPTRSGAYRVRAYRHTVGSTVTEPMCIMTGHPEGGRDIVVRVHDACFTSEVLGSLKCDCAEQLQLAMAYIQDCPPGIVVYLQQEGRGIGLANKIAAYALQEEGYDTVDANRQLGFADDCREYTSVRNILKDLNIHSIKLMTNNPRKMEFLKALGVNITERIPCIVEAQEFNRGYLNVKATRMDHVLEGPKLDGSYCYWNHSGDNNPLVSAQMDDSIDSTISSMDLSVSDVADSMPQQTSPLQSTNGSRETRGVSDGSIVSSSTSSAAGDESSQ